MNGVTVTVYGIFHRAFRFLPDTRPAIFGGAARAGREAFMGERQGDVALTGAQGSLGQGPVDDVALRVAATDLP